MGDTGREVVPDAGNEDKPEGGDVRGLVWITTRITRSGELAPRRAWLLRYLHFDSCFAHLRPQGSPSQPVAMMTRHLERWCLPALRVCQVSSFLLLVIFMTKERIDVDIIRGTTSEHSWKCIRHSL